MAWLGAVALLSNSSLAADPAAPQPDAPEPAAPEAATPATQAVSPPHLVTFVPAVYPPQALAEGQQASVELELTIDASGEVRLAEVSRSAGADFDSAALAAARAFRFEPARRGDQPVAARIRYTYAFELRAPSTATDARTAAPLTPTAEPPPGAALTPTAALPNAIASDPGSAQAPPASPSALATPGAPVVTMPEQAPPSDGTAPPAPVDQQPRTEVLVEGQGVARRLRQSAQEVKFIDTTSASRHTADLGQVLAHTEGVSVQRSGGLGAPTRLSLHGLTDDQIRVFVDGLPLDMAGFGFGIAGVPLAWLQRAEVYRGVVPIALGADALGGAIHLITDAPDQDSSATFSYAAGSFDTHQLAASARVHEAGSGVSVRALAFHDATRNDYLVDVDVPDELGRLSEARVRRFHDAYRATGGMLELSQSSDDRTRRVTWRGFGTVFDKDLQHNVNMTTPYGAVTYGQKTLGSSLRFEDRRLAQDRLALAATFAYSYRQLAFRDSEASVYDWFGRVVAERIDGAGELSPFASDLTQGEHRALSRAGLTWRLAPTHQLQLMVAPDHAQRSGKERLRVREDRIDPLTTDRSLTQVVTGLQYAAVAPLGWLENNLFAKHYAYHLDTDQVQVFDNSIEHIEDTRQRFGAGDSLSVRLAKAASAKASYEYATRLPRPDEVFGNGALVNPNLELEPESSHNGNLGVLFGDASMPAGTLNFDVTGFWRESSRLITVLPSPDRVHSSFQNVLSSRTLGVDGHAGWTAPGAWLALDGNATFQDQRNTASAGAFAAFRGERIPNRPWFFFNASVTLRAGGLASEADDLSLSWSSHYVHSFLPGWNEAGSASTGQRIPAQLLHDLSVTYTTRGLWQIDSTLDLVNLTDARAYDVLGVQKPGRAAFFKITTCWACPS